MTKFVYDFTEGNKDLKDLLGGKGANLAEMTNLGLPVPPGFTITTEACKVYLDSGDEPAELRDEVSAHLAALEKTMGKQPRPARRPAARLGALRREVLHARDDGDRPQHRAQRRVRAGAGQAGRRRALRLGLLPPADPDVRQDRPRTSTASSSRTPSTRRRRRAGHQERPRPRRGRPAAARRLVQGDRPQSTPAGTSRRTRASRWTSPSARSSTRGTPTARDPLPPPGAHPGRPRHRGQRLLDGLRQPRPGLRHRRRLHPRPGLRAPGRLRRLPAERPGRGRRRGHPQHRAARRTWRASTSRRTTSCMRDHGDAGEPLPRPVRHRVHHRARQAVDAADPGRQAHRGCGLPDRHPAGRPGPDRRGRGAPPGHRRPARPADVPALRRGRHEGTRSPRASPPRRVPRSARRSSTRTPRSSGRAPARRSSWSAARPTPTTSTA